MTITKENYREIVWDKSRLGDEYYDFLETLAEEEILTFIKFILEHYPDFDEEWMHYYFDISGKWEAAGEYDRIIDFVEFVRTKSPTVYKKEFPYLEQIPVLHALFYDDLEQAKIRFEESVIQPDVAIDDSLRSVFNILTTDSRNHAYAEEIAESVWKILETSKRLIGGAEFNYSAFLYCTQLESTFKKIQAGTTVDWDTYTTQTEAINFKYVEELRLLPTADVLIEEEANFHANDTYRQELIDRMSMPFMYYAYTEGGIPVYWAFRSWFKTLAYLLEDEDASKRSNWFSFTPKMIDRMGGRLVGFLGGNKEEMVITLYTIPYIYDYFLKQQYIDEETYNRLMEYYEFARREVLRFFGSTFWKYKGLYSWKKPNYLSVERYEKERALMLESINWTGAEGEKNIKEFLDSLPKLPNYVEPPIEPSPLERMMNRRTGTDFLGILGGGGSNSGSTRKLRKKKSRKKKHKDNRKRGAKKNKRK